MVETKTGEMMAEDLDRFVNMMGHDSQGFVGQVVHRTHRYLQQEIFILFMRCVGEWARCADSGVYDGRNEYTCRMSKRIRDEVFEGSL
jgi:hypothetical protein